MKHLANSSMLLGLTLLVILTGLQQFPDTLDKVFANPAIITEFPEDVYSIHLDSLPKDEYYLSLGRPRHFCDITYNDELIFKGKTSIHDKRPSLLVGAGFAHNGGSVSLVADCRQFMSGFEQRLSFPPRLYTYLAGVAIHNVRNFIDMAVGPISCLFLMLAAFFNYFFSKNTSESKRSHIFIVFSLVAFVYSLSLAHYTRVYMSGMAASQLHIILRTAFSLGMAALLHPKLFPGYLLLSLHLIIFFLSLCLPYLDIRVETFYLSSFLLYPITTFATLWASKKNDDSTYDSFFLQALLLSWGAAQALDWLKQLSGIGYFAAPLYLGAIALYLTYSVARQQSRLLKASSLAKTIESYIQSSLKPADLVKEIGAALHASSCYDLYSVYLLQSFLGGSENSTEFIKIKSYNSSEAPEKIQLDHLNAPIFAEAITHQRIVEGVGLSDNRRYLVLPLGNLGAICFSSSRRLPRYTVGETRQLINLLTPSLQLINEKLKSLVSLTGSSLNKLRTSYGDGTFPMTIGAIFIDIADYSKKAEQYGECYTSFISSQLLPALIKNMKDHSLPEVVRGDEVLFIVCDEKPDQARDISLETAKSIHRLSAYMLTEAQTLSSQEGYGKVEFRVGFTVGEGSIVIDDVQARTSGDHINRAKRLQDAAAKGEFLTDTETMSAIKSGSLLVLAKTSIVVKKNVIEAVKVGVKRAA